MKIAFVSFNFGEYSLRLATGIARASNADVLLLLPKDEALPYLHLISSTVTLQLFDKPRLRQPFRQLAMLAQVVRWIRAFAPDIIHLQQGHLWFNLFALPFLRAWPMVLTLHDCNAHPGDRESARTPQWVYHRGIVRAKEVIVHTAYVQQQLCEFALIPQSQVNVIPHILLGDDNPAPDVSSRKQVASVLFFGRIWKYKGLEYLIRAEPYITSKAPTTRIVIAGVGEDFESYRRIMVSPEHFIVYNEYISDANRTELFRDASIVVLPYIEASQSGVIPLAYRFHKPVVATAVGGLPEMVDHGITGYLVPPRDPEALAAAITTLLEDEPLRLRLGMNGYHKLNRDCDPRFIGNLTCNVYRRVLDIQ